MSRVNDTPHASLGSPLIRQTLELCRRYARFDRSIVFVGPVGVGKTTIAKEVFKTEAAEGRFVTVSCGELGGDLYLDVLFGHVSGAFTGAAIARRGAISDASPGVLLLDDVALMPKNVQSALLRVLESGRYRPLGCDRDERASCRVLFASTQEPSALVADGALLQDLASRMGELIVHVPPLSARREDILPIARHASEAILKEHGVTAQVRLSEEVQELIRSYEWPGNVRELRAVMERAAVHAAGTKGFVDIQSVHLPDRIRDFAPSPQADRRVLDANTIGWAVRCAGGNQSEAARQLGVHRNTVRRHLRAGR